MLKRLASLLLPSNKKIAASAAAKIRQTVNGAATGKEEVVVKYATLAAELSEMSATLSSIMKDAKIDEMEEATLAALLEPQIAKAREIIGV